MQQRNGKARSLVKGHFSPDLIQARQQSPTSMNEQGKVLGPERSARRRKQQTKQVAMEIHGATADNMRPAYEGLFSVINAAPLADLTNLVSKSPKVMTKVLPRLIRRRRKAFEDTDINFIRSVSVLYKGGIASKAKYRSIKKSLEIHQNPNCGGRRHIEFMQGVSMPGLLPYEKLQKRIENEISIGTLYDVRETLCAGMEEEEKVDGKYRDLLELLLRMAKFYFLVDKQRVECKLEWFGKEEGSFKVAIGGDGAPFGKDDQALAWLVSFLNVGKRISSRDENFLLFGANCAEDCLAARRYICMLGEQIIEIEKNTYSVVVDGIDKSVKFEFELLPNDMKYLAFIFGELPIGSTYVSPFADVHKNDLNHVQTGEFGTEPSCKWKPWKYSFRLKVAASVEKEKKKNANLKGDALRKKITPFIAKAKSRQEYKPLLGKIIDKAKVEPLHLKNNAWQHWHLCVMKYCLMKSNLANCATVFDVPPTSTFGRCTTIASRMKLKQQDWQKKLKNGGWKERQKIRTLNIGSLERSLAFFVIIL